MTDPPVQAKLQQFFVDVAEFMRVVVDAWPGPIIPSSVMDAADKIRLDVVALGGRDIGPPPSEAKRVPCPDPVSCTGLRGYHHPLCPNYVPPPRGARRHA